MSATPSLILPAVRLSRISPPRGGEYLHEVTAGSMNPLPSDSRPVSKLTPTTPTCKTSKRKRCSTKPTGADA
ncbi:hypothetical protein BRD06_12015 [Halobacteriales archaeon QS_9_67_15]|nr:MAG: hypothetical protein BRD06_12015 [Halobacteriales archaeon QS_9_67_15]